MIVGVYRHLQRKRFNHYPAIIISATMNILFIVFFTHSKKTAEIGN